MTTEEIKELNDYAKWVLLQNFTYPEERIKSWISKDTYTNLYNSDWNEIILAVERTRSKQVFKELENAPMFNDWMLNDWVKLINDKLVSLDKQEIYNTLVGFIIWYKKVTYNGG